MTTKSEDDSVLPKDHASICDDSAWSIAHLEIDKRAISAMRSDGLSDLRDASADRLRTIKGIGPKILQTVSDAIEVRIAAIAETGTPVPDAREILDGTYRYPAPSVRKPNPKRSKAAGKPKTKSARKRIPQADATPAPQVPVAEPFDPAPMEARIDDATDAPATVDAVPHAGPSQVMSADASSSAPAGAETIEVSGGFIFVENLDGGRMRVTCHDRFLLPHVREASSQEGGIGDGTGWMHDPDSYASLIKRLRGKDMIEELRATHQHWSRPSATHVTPRGDLHIRHYQSRERAYIFVHSLPYSERTARRLDVVCSALGGFWSQLNRCWSLPAHQQAPLLRAMEEDIVPEAPASLDSYATPDRTVMEAGLEYASVYAVKPDLDWYESVGQTMQIDTPKGPVEIVRVNPDIWIARKPNKSTRTDVMGVITSACGTMLGDLGNWHSAFAGRRFKAADRDRVFAALREGAEKRGSASQTPLMANLL